MPRKEKTAPMPITSADGRKVYVRPETHKALKRFAADQDKSMFELADAWICERLVKAGETVRPRERTAASA